MSTKISVLVPEDEAIRFEAYCTDRGYKKSTLIVRLIKELLDKESYPSQGSLLSPSHSSDWETSGNKRK